MENALYALSYHAGTIAPLVMLVGAVMAVIGRIGMKLVGKPEPKKIPRSKS